MGIPPPPPQAKKQKRGFGAQSAPGALAVVSWNLAAINNNPFEPRSPAEGASHRNANSDFREPGNWAGISGGGGGGGIGGGFGGGRAVGGCFAGNERETYIENGGGLGVGWESLGVGWESLGVGGGREFWGGGREDWGGGGSFHVVFAGKRKGNPFWGTIEAHLLDMIVHYKLRYVRTRLKLMFLAEVVILTAFGGCQSQKLGVSPFHLPLRG